MAQAQVKVSTLRIRRANVKAEHRGQWLVLMRSARLRNIALGAGWPSD